MERQESLVVIGGGPGGYEAALVAAALGAKVTVIDRDGVGGAAVLTDCVPSKALISTAAYVASVAEAENMGVRFAGQGSHAAMTERVRQLHREVHGEDAPLPEASGGNPEVMTADATAVNQRIIGLAAAQSRDIHARLQDVGVEVVRGVGHLVDASTIAVTPLDGAPYTLNADMVLVATGATPRILPTAVPDGERILTWKDIWSLHEIPEHIIVVGSGVTGAELAQAYLGIGSKVTLVSSREYVLPGQDQDAAQVIEAVFRRRGMSVLSRSRAESVKRVGDGVEVVLSDGRVVAGSHALMAVGSVPCTNDLGLAEAGVAVNESGYIQVDRVSRTTVRGVYAAGDCTGVLPLASVAATQGRIAVAHALGDAVTPLQTEGISANIFTDPEIATVGLSQAEVDAMDDVRTIRMSLATNPRAKMDNLQDGFVKLFSRSNTNVLLGGVVVAPRASELIFPIALAVQHRMTAEQVAATMTVYPSLSGSIAEAARRLHKIDD